MNFILKINNEPIEEYYCEIHKKWNWVEDEMNCCAIEIEERLCDEYDCEN